MVTLPQVAAFDYLLVRGEQSRVPSETPGARWRRVDGNGLWTLLARE